MYLLLITVSTKLQNNTYIYLTTKKLMKKIFVVYGHYDENSFNAAIRDTFIKSVEKNGHSVDLIDLYKDKFEFVLNEMSNTFLKIKKFNN